MKIGHLINSLFFSALVIGSTKTNLILSRKAYNIIAMFIFPIGFAIGYVPPYVMTCCKYEFHHFFHFYTVFLFRVIYYFKSFSINFVALVYDPIENKYVLLDRVTYKYVHRPFFIIATIIPIVCYTYVRFTKCFFITNISRCLGTFSG